jgi:hypothetical protein
MGELIQEIELVDIENGETESKDLLKILRRVGKEAIIYLLEEKYGTKEKINTTNESFVHLIEMHPEKEEIIRILNEIYECCLSVHEETFIEFCRNYGVQGIIFNEPLAVTALKCYFQMPENYKDIKVFSAVNKEKQFDVYRGKTVTEEIQFRESHRDEIKQVLESLIEPGRKYIIGVTQLNDEIIMTAHFEMRKKTFTTISSGETIETVVIRPATKAVAKYNTKENCLRVKSGPGTKLKNYIIETFGKVFFKDNSHFKGENYQIYKLDEVRKDDFSLVIDNELEEEIESAVIKEEVIRIPINDDVIKLTIQAADAEKALEYLSNENINLKAQKREQITIEITIKESINKRKKIKVMINDSSKISFDPKYTAIVHKCLTKWGIEIGTN